MPLYFFGYWGSMRRLLIGFIGVLVLASVFLGILSVQSASAFFVTSKSGESAGVFNGRAEAGATVHNAFVPPFAFTTGCPGGKPGTETQSNGLTCTP